MMIKSRKAQVNKLVMIVSSVVLIIALFFIWKAAQAIFGVGR